MNTVVLKNPNKILCEKGYCGAVYFLLLTSYYFALFARTVDAVKRAICVLFLQ